MKREREIFDTRWEYIVQRPGGEVAVAGTHSTSYEHDKEALLLRLRKMEGQVRGLQQMVQDDRYCLDIVQQINALSAAAREVSLIVLQDHLQECVANALSDDDREAALKEMMRVLDKALRQ
jgi:CsoR family transcriptional regulator, copper-sensing transcriptional repressor